MDADGGDAIGEGDGGEGGTVLERTVTDGGDVGREGDGGEGGALEGAAADLG